MSTRKLTLSALLIALGTLSAHVIYIPVGVSKCFPIQHTINVLSGVLLGPGYALANAFIISLLRNILGTGSLLAFPGSIFGAFLAGLLFRKSKKYYLAVLGEVFGTGILGGIACYPIAKFVLGQEVAVFFFVLPFLVSTAGGSIIGYSLLKIIDRIPLLKKLIAK